MSIKEYRTASEARGGLIVVRDTPGVAFGDRVRITDGRGETRDGQVIRAADDEVLILVFEGTDDIDLDDIWVRFLDEPVEIALSPELLGREFNGLGEPRDGRPPVLSNIRRAVGGAAINPAARTYPREFIQTGISTIDGLNSLVRGQKLPIFVGLRSAAQPPGGADRAPGEAEGRGLKLLDRVRGHGRLLCRRQVLPRRIRLLRCAA